MLEMQFKQSYQLTMRDKLATSASPMMEIVMAVYTDVRCGQFTLAKPIAAGVRLL
ncbi:hypothetical protein SAMN05428964_109114 [Thalassospira xiamenensis]|uniref:Uncharacterized protein n=1 Tax=Thalassospira xiamenensis TaxID=220697 RepID=A0A285U2C8_9PROT|nr:hypothetical protein SAMN05428964_109114 [Thalassospira xiamenensis]